MQIGMCTCLSHYVNHARICQSDYRKYGTIFGLVLHAVVLGHSTQCVMYVQLVSFALCMLLPVCSWLRMDKTQCKSNFFGCEGFISCDCQVVCGCLFYSHVLELVIGSFVLPYNLTVMEALLIYRGSPLELAKGSCDASTVVTPYSLWAGTHTIQ